MDEYNPAPERTELREGAGAAPETPAAPPVAYEPWMSLHPSVTPEQWQAHRARMSPSEWEEYCGKWRAHYSASQTPPGYAPSPAPPYGAPYAAPPYGPYPVYPRKPSKIKPLISAIWPPVAFIGSQFAAGVAVAFVLIFAAMIGTDLSSLQMDAYPIIDDIMPQMFEIVTILSVCLQAVFVPVFLVCFLRDRKRAEREVAFPADKPPAAALTVIGIGAATGLFFVISSMLLMLERFLPSFMVEQYGELMEQIMGDMGLLSFISVVILAPVVEELCMRGLVQRRLGKLMPEGAAIFVASAIFGLMHMNIIQSTYAFTLGLIFGWMYHRGKNLMIPILAHLAFNGMNYLVSAVFGYFEENPGVLGAEATRHITEATPLYAGVAAASGLALTVLMMFLYARLSRARDTAAV